MGVASVVVLGLALLGVSRAQAGQGPMDPMGTAREMMTAAPMLLGLPDVRRELKLTSVQDKKIEAIRKAHTAMLNELGKSGRGNPASVEGMLASMGKMREATAKAEADIRAELTPEQGLRLRGMQYQAMRARALYEKDLQKTLGATPEQAAKIAEVKAGDLARAQSLLDGSGSLGDPNAMIKKIKASRAEAERLLMAILTPEQAAKYREALGTPIKALSRLAETGF